MWECSQLTMCFKFLYYIIMYKSNSNENVPFFFMGIVIRHFLIVHAMHHKYWILQKSLRAIISSSKYKTRIWGNTETIRFLQCEQKNICSGSIECYCDICPLRFCFFFEHLDLIFTKINTWCKIMFLSTSVDPSIRNQWIYLDFW